MLCRCRGCETTDEVRLKWIMDTASCVIDPIQAPEFLAVNGDDLALFVAAAHRLVCHEFLALSMRDCCSAMAS
jgi:hypothetical protein